jgi:hypothetical protein
VGLAAVAPFSRSRHVQATLRAVENEVLELPLEIGLLGNCLDGVLSDPLVMHAKTTGG